MRVHVDLYTDQQQAHVERLGRLGATRVDDRPDPDDADIVVLRDPDGNEFCVIDLAELQQPWHDRWVPETPEPEYLVEREVAPAVFLAEPDLAWASQHAAEERLIRGALGSTLRGVEHVGSTSVPGLVAKPVIDIVLTVEEPAAEAAYVPPLESLGYLLHHREPHWHQHRLLKKGTPHWSADRPDGPRVNLHVFPAGCDKVRRMLAFRNWLRVDETDRRRYEDTKRRLASMAWRSVQEYADAKTDVVAAIMERALAAQPSKRDGSPAPTRTTSG